MSSPQLVIDTDILSLLMERTVLFSRGLKNIYPTTAESVGFRYKPDSNNCDDSFASPKPMRQKYPRGHFQKLFKEGTLKIEYASTKEVSLYEEIAADVLERIFDMDRRSCLISDESSLWDFRADQSRKTIWRRIEETYGLDVSDVADGNLVTILKRIDWQRKSSC